MGYNKKWENQRTVSMTHDSYKCHVSEEILKKAYWGKSEKNMQGISENKSESFK